MLYEETYIYIYVNIQNIGTDNSSIVRKESYALLHTHTNTECTQATGRNNADTFSERNKKKLLLQLLCVTAEENICFGS
jgi:hypothetical protein